MHNENIIGEYMDQVIYHKLNERSNDTQRNLMQY